VIFFSLQHFTMALFPNSVYLPAATDSISKFEQKKSKLRSYLIRYIFRIRSILTLFLEQGSLSETNLANQYKMYSLYFYVYWLRCLALLYLFSTEMKYIMLKQITLLDFDLHYYLCIVNLLYQECKLHACSQVCI